MDNDEFGGALKSPELEECDWVFEALACGGEKTGNSISIPEVFDLRDDNTLIRNQFRRGTCAAFAAAYIKEVHAKMNSGEDVILSPEFIYYHRENKPSRGMYGRNVFHILKNIGTVPEAYYTYQPDDQATQPIEDLYKIAANYRISDFARVLTMMGAKRAIYELGPCYLLLPLRGRGLTFWKGEDNLGGHAVAIVGFNKSGFIIRNSWGRDWGDNGYTIFPYDDWKYVWECWAVIDGERTIIPVAKTVVTEKQPAGVILSIDDINKLIPPDTLPGVKPVALALIDNEPAVYKTAPDDRLGGLHHKDQVDSVVSSAKRKKKCCTLT